ncbi:MAG: hypothetical protein J5809_01095 [Selenomonadaceae bacterium]|nr:hypothetical protein [Selenomonadaceae bacterium]
MKALDKIPALGVVIVCAGIFLIQNLLTPVIGDDYAYAFIWDGAQNGNFQNNIGRLYRVESIGDIFVSQWSHWLTWGGRSVAHFFVQFFMMFDKVFFDVANALIYAALALLIYFLAAGKFELRTGAMLWIFFALWFCLPEFFQTTLWLTGSCNYLWMTVIQLAFLLPFALKFWRGKCSVPVPLMAFAGLLAGWSNESGGAFTIFLAFLAMVYFWRQKKFERWMLAGFIALFIGYALLMLAPGNFQRYVVDANEATVPYLSAQMFIDNFEDGMSELLWYDLLPLLVIAGYFLRGRKTPQTTLFVLAFTAAGILLLFMLMFSPEFPARAAFASPVFLIIATVAALDKISFELPRKLVAVACAFWLATSAVSVSVDWSVHSQLQERQKYIAAHRNEDLIVVDPINLPLLVEKIFWSWTLDAYSRFYGDLTPYLDKLNNRNITYAQYYGLKQIIINEEKWAKQTRFILY